MNVGFIKAGKGDIPKIFEMQKTGYLEDFWETFEWLQQVQATYPEGVWLFAVGGEIAGYGIYFPEQCDMPPKLQQKKFTLHQKPNAIHMFDVYVMSKFQGQGIASAFFEFVEGQARCLRFGCITLTAIQESHPRWIRKGFSVMQKFSDYHKGNPAVFMRKHL